MRVLLPAALATIAALTACNRQSEEGGRDSGSEVGDMIETNFSQCVRDAIPKPWAVVDASLQQDDFVVRVAAASKDLQLPHRDNESREQQFVDVSIGRFTSHSVFNPQLLAGYINSGTLRATTRARSLAASDLAPLAVYEFGNADVLLLINPRQGEFCIDRAIPPHWPNPFTRCELVVERYSGGFTVSSEALGSLPRLFMQVRQLIDQATTCFNRYKDDSHG